MDLDAPCRGKRGRHMKNSSQRRVQISGIPSDPVVAVVVVGKNSENTSKAIVPFSQIPKD